MNYGTRIHIALTCTSVLCSIAYGMDTQHKLPTKEPFLLKDQTHLALCILKKAEALPPCPPDLQEQDYLSRPLSEKTILHCLAHRNIRKDPYCSRVLDLATQKKDLSSLKTHPDIAPSLTAYLTTYNAQGRAYNCLSFDGTQQPNPRAVSGLLKKILLDAITFRNALTSLGLAQSTPPNDPIQMIGTLNTFDTANMHLLCPSDNTGWSKKLEQGSLHLDASVIVSKNTSDYRPITTIEGMLDSCGPQTELIKMDDFTNTNPKITAQYREAWQKRTNIVNQYTQD